MALDRARLVVVLAEPIGCRVFCVDDFFFGLGVSETFASCCTGAFNSSSLRNAESRQTKSRTYHTIRCSGTPDDLHVGIKRELVRRVLAAARM